MLFRSLQKLLMDTAAHEYLFCCDFWGEDSVYQDLFQQVLAFVETSLSAILQVSKCLLAEDHAKTLLLVVCWTLEGEQLVDVEVTG